MVEETKHDLLLKRVQITIAILAGLTTLIIGIYNVKKSVFSEKAAGTISLSILFDHPRGPANQAHVELSNAQSVVVSSQDSSPGGRYSKEGLEPGTYILKISSPGHENYVASVQAEPKKTTFLEITLKSYSQTPSPANPLRSALEDAGASWIQSLKKPQAQTADKNK